ncbi:MAG: NAD-dependent epimerase/dehydratase family protein [Deltaproteobacteria bacterium]|nr:NAD-dependent epimerase/dehydratase family protein [Deltaproteobacteria bacterium]
MSVLVTGAESVIGEQLVRALVADARVGHVIAASCARRPSPFTPTARLTPLQLNLASARQVHDLLFGMARDLRVEVVVHLAAHPRAHARGRSVRQVNVEAVRAILALSHRHPTIRRVVIKSYAEVYHVSSRLPVLVTEDHPLNLSPGAPQYIRDRVEADLTACSRMGLANAEIAVLRCAETLAEGTGSQLYDYLSARFALRPAGFDPMINVATVDDVVAALELATHRDGDGVYNIPGADTLPVSEALALWGTPTLPAPGLAIAPLYRARHLLSGADFSYGLNARRMHFGLVLSGDRARDELGYVPSCPVRWPGAEGGRIG